jgi:signal transduction histidine kinase
MRWNEQREGTVTLGLPTHLIASTMNRTVARAAHWFGLVCLAGALAGVVALSAAHPYDGLWPTMLALVPMAILLITLTRHHTVVATVGYLVVGAASTYIYAVTILSDVSVYPTTDMFVVALPVMALVMVGGTGSGPLIGLLWSAIGLILGEAAVIAAAATTGVPYEPAAFAPATFLLVAVVLISVALDRGRARAAQPSIHQASRRTSAYAARRVLGDRAMALMHDTALSHLVAIASAEPGAIDPRLRAMIARDLERLVGQDWLFSREALSDAAADWLATPLADAIATSRAQGLTVDVSGDRAAVLLLDPDRGEALGLAVQQCLVNVLRHAGVADAEVSISATGREVVVTVTDAGSGFVPELALGARIGLRHSVVARVEGIGGAVRVFSTPGEGTSVLLAVPLAGQSVAADDQSEVAS